MVWKLVPKGGLYMKRIKLIVAILCVVIFFNISTIVSLAQIVQSPAGCNYIVDDGSLPEYNSYVFYKTSLTPYAANSAIANAIATWNGVIPTMQLSLSSGTKDFNTEDSFEVVESYLGKYQAGDKIFISYGGTVFPQDIETSGEKIMYLKKNILNYSNQEVYSFVSVSQGIYFEEDQMKNKLGKSFNVAEVQRKYERK